MPNRPAQQIARLPLAANIPNLPGDPNKTQAARFPSS